MTDFIHEDIGECRFPGDLRYVREALEKMKEFYLARGLRPNVWSQVELASAEAINNAIEHGCERLPASQVSVRWTWVKNVLRVEVTDPGFFEPSAASALLPDDPLAEGGRGHFLMTTLMDAVRHSNSGSGHTVIMEKEAGFAAWDERAAAEMESTIESMAEDLSRSYEDLSALFRFAEELATSTTLPDFLDRSLPRLMTLVTGQAAYVRFASQSGKHLDLVAPSTAMMAGIAPRLRTESGAMEAAAFTRSSPVTIEDCTNLPTDDPLHTHPGGAFACPIFFRSTVLGCLVVRRSAKDGYFSAGELGLIRVVADFLGIVRTTSLLQEQRQMEQRAVRELEIASSIQQSLLPRDFPDSANYRLFGLCQSAQQVGGDYFDALQLPQGGILLVIADVMGKGVPAALLATILRTAIYARLDMAQEPGRLLTAVNRQITRDLSQLDMFITAQVAYLSHSENTLLVANAGHCPLLLCKKTHSGVRQLKGEGVPLGVIDIYEYPTQRYAVEEGERFVFLTDGLYEVEDLQEEMLGIERLVQHIDMVSDLLPSDFCAKVLEFVRNYSGRQPASDDRTLLTLERLR